MMPRVLGNFGARVRKVLEMTVEGPVPNTTADVSRASKDVGTEAEEGKEESEVEKLEGIAGWAKKLSTSAAEE